jgi:hypothetical protein
MKSANRIAQFPQNRAVFFPLAGVMRLRVSEFVRHLRD